MNKRIMSAFGWGIIATILMSIVMIIGKQTGTTPMPKPIPMAMVVHIFGADMAKPFILLLSISSNFI